MARKLRNALVVDVESTCWENGGPPEGEVSEIIEIGVCRVSLRDLSILDRESILVIPTASHVSPFCTTLTGHTVAELTDNGLFFGTALSRLREKWNSDKLPWFSWGDYDRDMFTKQCERTGDPYPFGRTHTNLKFIFAVAEGSQEVGVEKALAWSRMEFEGRPHNGGDDAYNIARLLKRTFSKT